MKLIFLSAVLIFSTIAMALELFDSYYVWQELQESFYDSEKEGLSPQGTRCVVIVSEHDEEFSLREYSRSQFRNVRKMKITDDMKFIRITDTESTRSYAVFAPTDTTFSPSPVITLTRADKTTLFKLQTNDKDLGFSCLVEDDD